MSEGRDLTELVQHLKTVHFALLLACILTLLPTMVGRRGEVSEAHRQLENIQAMRNSWDRWTQKFSLEQIAWFQTLGVHWLAPEPEHAYIDSATLTQAGLRHSPGYVLGVRLVGVPLYFHLNIKDRLSEFILAVPYGQLNVSDVLPLPISFPGEDSGSKRFTSLTDFRGFWAGAQMPMVTFLQRMSAAAYLVVDGAIRSELKLKEKERASGTQEFQRSKFGGCPGLELALIRTHVGDPGFNELFCADYAPGRLVIPVEIRTVRIPTDLQQWLIKEFRLDGAGGDFSKMFPKLDKVASVIQTLDIDKISQILKAELDRQGDRIQFLGISLPEPQMASWGMIIVLAIQSYLWLHLRAFKKRAWSSSLDGSRHAWIPLYDDWWASCVTIITIGIFPMGVIIWAGCVSSWPPWLSIGIAAIVLTLALNSLYLLGLIPHFLLQAAKRLWLGLRI